MKTRLEVESELRALKPMLSQNYFVDKIGYFGSYARNEQTVDSDIDILVRFKKPLGWAFFELQELLESKLNLRVDLVTERSLKQALKPKILDSIKYL